MPRLTPIVVLVAALAAAAPAAASAQEDPPWSVPVEELAAAVECPDAFAHPEREPVLLVHGTGTTGREQWGWNYLLLLADEGFDACIVTYPDRGLGDQQVSAEFVAYAVGEVHRRTGSMVDVVGHSQGGVLPRWAIRFWPSVRAVVDDAVLVAPPSHGTSIASDVDRSPIPQPPAYHQFDPDSQFVRALNSWDETPGEVSWTVLYSHLDALVQPAAPVPTAALDWGREGPLVRNIAVDGLCPGRVVDHLSIGVTDRLAQALVLDALTGPGPADPARLGALGPACAVPDQYVAPAAFLALLEQLPASMRGGFPEYERVHDEPPLQPYAAAALDAPSGPSGASGTAGGGTPGPTGSAPSEDTATGGPGAGDTSAVRGAGVGRVGRVAAGPAGTGSELPATGNGAPTALAAALLAAAAVVRRVTVR